MQSPHPIRQGRLVATSNGGGATWFKPIHDPVLTKPCCQANLIRIADRVLQLFSKPASTRRERLIVRLSNDGGKTWPLSRVFPLAPQPAPASRTLSKPGRSAVSTRAKKRNPHTSGSSSSGSCWIDSLGNDRGLTGRPWLIGVASASRTQWRPKARQIASFCLPWAL